MSSANSLTSHDTMKCGNCQKGERAKIDGVADGILIKGLIETPKYRLFVRLVRNQAPAKCVRTFPALNPLVFCGKGLACSRKRC